MSDYSLARLRHLRPAPPFRLGGWFWREGTRCYLGDALSRVELLGPPGMFAEARDGDQIVVSVVRSGDFSRMECDKMLVAVRREGEPAHKYGARAGEFTEFVRKVRAFFVERGLTEMRTPTLVTCPGLEPSLEPFAVSVTRGRDSVTAYLPTSPEIHLKKVLTRGWTDIFEIKTCFRRGEFSAHHANEFHMLEWYRGFADLDMILSDLRALIAAVDVRTSDGRPLSSRMAEPRIVRFADLFREWLEFELRPDTTRDELRTLCTRLGLYFQESDSFNDLFHRVLIDRLEPRFADFGPLVIRDFPPSMAALARLTSEGWADRFEFYWNGLEIANAFNEVNDPSEQARRWADEQSERRHLGTSEVPDDPALIEALRAGMPPTGGIALGVERLFMAIHGVSEIRELALFASDDLFER